MKKALSPIFIIVLLGFIGYDHKDDIIDHTKFLINNPAEKVLNANLPQSDTIYDFQSEIYGELYLLAGTEEDFGLRHILARHTKNYFINYKDKNDATQFAENVSGKDILLGIEDFYEHCVDVSDYNSHPDRNIAYVGYADIDGDNIKCLLIVRREENTIVTFYPFVEGEFDRNRRDVILD